MKNKNYIIEQIAETLVTAGSTFSSSKKRAYERAIAMESDKKARWALKTLLENGLIAEQNRTPLCDDTGIPHLFLEVGQNSEVTGELLKTINAGVAEGLRRLPGRPMAVRGDDMARLSQLEGMYEDPGMLEPAPLVIRDVSEDVLRLSILLFGGGPAIRGCSYHVFHEHDISIVRNQIIEWSLEACSLLGCTPCTLAIGIGRSHYEAATLMLEAQIYGDYDVQSEFESEIVEAVNASNIGSLGIGGSITTLAAFVKIGPQRASGVRIVCLRPCCCYEPRIAKVQLFL